MCRHHSFASGKTAQGNLQYSRKEASLFISSGISFPCETSSRQIPQEELHRPVCRSFGFLCQKKGEQVNLAIHYVENISTHVLYRQNGRQVSQKKSHFFKVEDDRYIFRHESCSLFFSKLSSVSVWQRRLVERSGRSNFG